MITMMAARAIKILIAATLFAPVVASSPQVNFPLSSQLPPIARTGEAYSFQFASTTFQSNPDKLQYSLIGNPSWLSLSSRNRTLWGTPGAGDAGIVTFTIAAAGEAGAVANMDSKLLVVDHDLPRATANITQQLSGAGQLSGSTNLTLLPLSSFEVKFSSDLFQTTGSSLSYHATLTDHTPLPAWISFDAPSLRFAGTTPPLTSSPQPYEILLIASDVPNYAAASISFTLVISNHQLLFRPLQQTMKLSKGDQVKISDLRGMLYLDNQSVPVEDIESAAADIPSWLSFDKHSFEITGSPPPGLMSQDVSVTVHDRFGDTTKHSIRLLFKSNLFTGEIGRLNITAGEDFEYTVPRSLLARTNEDVSIDFSSLTEWLHFSPATLTISGKLPDDFASQDFQVSLTAKSLDDQATDSQTFQIHVSGAGTHIYPGSTTTGSDSAQPSTSGEAYGTHSHHSRREGIIVASVLGSIFALGLLAALVMFLCRRRKQRRMKGYISPQSPRSPRKGPRSPRKADISRPIPIVDELEDVDKTMDADLEKGDSEDSTPERTLERPPRLDLNLPGKKKPAHAANVSIDEGESKILTAFDHSDLGFKDETGPSHRPAESMRIPTELARRESDNSNRPTKHRRRTTAVYRDTYRSSGLPLNQRLSGLGHGRNIHSPSRCGNSCSAYRRTMSYSSYGTASTSILSVAPSVFPQPSASAARHTTQLTTPMEKRCSIRLVAASTTESLLDRRTIDEKRKSFIRKRASAQFSSQFFAAGSSRVSASSYKSPPGLLSGSESFSRGALAPLAANIVVRPNDDITEQRERELPESLRIRKPSETPTGESPPPPPSFAGSLRKPPTERSFTQRHTTAATSTRERMQKRYERPGTSVYTRFPPSRRSSTRYSLRTQEYHSAQDLNPAQELKSSLNSLTDSKIYEDKEISASEYETEEEDIADYEKRTTLKASGFMLPPLNIPGLQREARRSQREIKRDSKKDKRESKRELKRTSQREATPYSLALEHGGKENHSSTYSLVPTNKPTTSKAKSKSKATDPERERERHRTAIAQRSTRHVRTESGTSTTRPLSRHNSNTSQTRHSRKSKHIRTQSRASNPKPSKRDRSKIQSSAFPYFDPATIIRPPTIGGLGASCKEKENAGGGEGRSYFLPRDASGNIVDYGLHENPLIEELGHGSLGFRASNGRVSEGARNSRFAQLHQHSYSRSLKRDSRRDTAIRPKTPSHSHFRTPSSAAAVGLGLDFGLPLGDPNSTPGLDRERTPLSTLDFGNGNGTSPLAQKEEFLRVVSGKGRRPVSVEVKEGGNGKGRRTWGSLKAVMGRAPSVWREEREKAFI